MKIMLSHGEQKKLAKDFKVSHMTVYRALSGKRDTPQAKMLRKAAIERGGMEFKPNRFNQSH